MTRDPHTDDRCERLRAVLCDRRIHALLLTLAVVAVLATGLAVAQQDDDEIIYLSQGGGESGISAWNNDTASTDWSYDPDNNRVYNDIELSPDGSVIYGAERGGATNGNISAVDASSGSELWHHDYPSDRQEGVYPGPDGELVVFVGHDGIHVVDSSDGSELWSESGLTLWDVVVTSDGDSLIATGTDAVYAYNVSDGSQEWTNSDNSDIVQAATIDHTTDTVYVGGRDNEVRELDTEDGTATDSVSVGGRVEGLEYRDGSVYAAVGFGSASVDRVDTTGSMSVDWSEQLSSSDHAGDVSVSPDGESVYAGDHDNGNVSRLDATTGVTQWQREFGGDVVSITTTNTFSEIDVGLPDPDADPQLEIDTRIWMEPGSETGYTVTHYPEYTNETRGPSEDVTGNASLTSDNTTVLSVDTAAHSLNASADNYARVTLNASHDGLETTHNVTVSPMTAEYLEIIPGPYRFTATFNETGFQMILIAIMSGVVATRLSTAFGGIGAAQLVLLIGWFAGFVSLGIALVGLFTAMFIGFNLAANVDYSVRR